MNTEWLMFGALFLLLAIWFVVALPQLWQRGVEGESVIDWLNIRQHELASEPEDLLEEAKLRVVEELGPAPDTRVMPLSKAPKFRAWSLLLGTVLASAWLYSQLGAQDDVDISERLASLENATPAEIQSLVDAIALRVVSRPENVDYLSLLGEYYTGSEQLDKALAMYEQLLVLMPENPDVLARAAQSEFLANGRKLSARAAGRAEAALAAVPNQRAALGTLGMAAFEAENYDDAVRYWERLAQLELPGSSDRVMIDKVLATAKARAGVTDAASTVSAEDTPQLTSDLGINISISAVADPDISPSTVIFVLARPAGSTQRMPVAVQRLTVADLPSTVRLDDLSSMAGQKVSLLPALDIEVQLSPSGQPGLDNATWVARANNIAPSANGTIVLSLTPAVR
ncbi:hypothetical protein N9R27_00160 [Flavobacteriaceae bacterium]|nr:hypothetical protein [Flavobacteriaceae bacterium]